MTEFMLREINLDLLHAVRYRKKIPPERKIGGTVEKRSLKSYLVVKLTTTMTHHPVKDKITTTVPVTFPFQDLSNNPVLRVFMEKYDMADKR